LFRRRSGAGSAVLAIGRRADAIAELDRDLLITTASIEDTLTSAISAVVAPAADAHGRVTGVATCIGSLILKPAAPSPDR
jgi:NAD(P)-dependent dehydrogenase (short-subunit alcohol dehydrogenase family)